MAAMTEPEVYSLENKYGLRGIESKEKHLQYFYDDDRLAVGISGEKGMTVLTIAQARAVCQELEQVLEVYFGGEALNG